LARLLLLEQSLGGETRQHEEYRTGGGPDRARPGSRGMQRHPCKGGRSPPGLPPLCRHPRLPQGRLAAPPHRSRRSSTHPRPHLARSVRTYPPRATGNPPRPRSHPMFALAPSAVAARPAAKPAARKVRTIDPTAPTPGPRIRDRCCDRAGSGFRACWGRVVGPPGGSLLSGDGAMAAPSGSHPPTGARFDFQIPVPCCGEEPMGGAAVARCASSAAPGSLVGCSPGPDL